MPLDSDSTQENIFKELRENPWPQIKCEPFTTHYSWQFKKCSNWCDLFARCFNESGIAHWVRQCSAMFRQSSPSQIAAASDKASLPVMDTFHVHPCSSLWKNEYVVGVSRCNCSEDDNETGKWTLPVTAVLGCLLFTRRNRFVNPLCK